MVKEIYLGPPGYRVWPEGKPVARGKSGTDGTNGVDGTDGTDGVDGVDGIDGVDGAPGPSVWGVVTGTLSDQLDLQAALDAKSPSTSPTFVTPALGTPISGVATNLTGTAAGLTAGSVTTNANLTGDVTSSGNATTLTNAPVIAKVLTAYASGAGTVAATDSILEAIQKLNGNDGLKANLASPVFTGTPSLPTGTTATTQSAADSTTKLATTAFVTTADDLKANLISPSFTTPALGTPTAGVMTNVTGTAASLTAGTVTTNANLTGDVTSSGNATTLTNAPVIAKVLTGYSSGAGTVAATDTILQAFQKLNGNNALKADIASPTLTGVPAAPTAAVDTNTTQIATTAYVIAQAYAKLASPTFSGTPSLPTGTTASTQSAADNSTKLATTAFATTADDLKANLASATLTGTPAAPTAAVDTNTTQLATTAFVLAQSAAATPLIDGVAAVGTATRYARADHVHPIITYLNAPVGVIFTAPPITGVNLKAAGTTTVFAVPAAKTFVCIRADVVVTAVASAGVGVQNCRITESGAGSAMTPNTASVSTTPAVGFVYVQSQTAGTSPVVSCATGNNVQFVTTTSHAGSGTVTGAVYVTGFYY